jgi:hypothetical protein
MLHGFIVWNFAESLAVNHLFFFSKQKHHMQSLFADLNQKMFCQIPTGNFNFQGWNLPCPAMSYY